jgi:type II secretory pathway pseudopilin PulG
LLELLVVAAIIGILAGLLLVVLSRAKERGRAVSCLNNTRQLLEAVHLYAADADDWLPPNPEDGNTNAWVGGNMWSPFDATNTALLIDPRAAKLAPYTGNAAALYKCPSDSSTVAINGTVCPRVRSYAMNQAVGTKSDPALAAVDGAWLDGTHHHKAGHPWLTYGRFADMTRPSPSELWVVMDENQYTINDAAFAVSMTLPTGWIDMPSTSHDGSGCIAFADSHCEIHRWTDPRTRLTTSVGPGLHVQTPNNRDVLWLQARTSARASITQP